MSIKSKFVSKSINYVIISSENSDYGLSVFKQNGKPLIINNITQNFEHITILTKYLSENNALPEHISDIVEDYLYDPDSFISFILCDRNNKS